jgi:hypothetical protein
MIEFFVVDKEKYQKCLGVLMEVLWSTEAPLVTCRMTVSETGKVDVYDLPCLGHHL